MKFDSVFLDEADDVKWFDVPGDVRFSVEDEELLRQIPTTRTVSVSIGYRGPFPVCPEEEVATHLEWDMFMPSGLVSVVSDDPKPQEIMIIGGRGHSKPIGLILAALKYAGIKTLLVSPEQYREFVGAGIPEGILSVIPYCRPVPLVEVNPVNTRGGFSPRSRAGKAHRWR